MSDDINTYPGLLELSGCKAFMTLSRVLIGKYQPVTLPSSLKIKSTSLISLYLDGVLNV